LVRRIWREDEKSNGNGMDCSVRINSEMLLDEFLEKSGTVPIPPYFNRKAEASDAEAYNTVYANQGGSVAAPTAGLHFTDPILAQIGKDHCSYLSLHVGAGTFKPVVSEDARDHAMHAESFSVSVREVRRIIQALESGKALVVVGTTSCRTLESLFWCGVKRIRGFDVEPQNLRLDQFEWIPLGVGEGKSTTPASALRALVEGMEDTDQLSGRTSLMITPNSYNFKVVDHLVTNFHAPDSTLMLLVSSFLSSGEKIRQIYEDAQEQGYRFLSYGDSCMFSRPSPK
jgi:S-adenosylmethionine:tRNA ribosyltransferase-isomerase